uniref:Uncharacterized protein n=1 Tax=Tetranychus urticae TaxID=32264 RepID=T1L1C6_TETUR
MSTLMKQSSGLISKQMNGKPMKLGGKAVQHYINTQYIKSN